MSAAAYAVVGVAIGLAAHIVAPWVGERIDRVFCGFSNDTEGLGGEE